MPSLPLPSPSYPTMIVTEPDFDSDVASDATLDDYEAPSYLQGAPLTRMVTLEYLSSPSIQGSDSDDLESEEAQEYLIRDEEINYVEDDMSLFNLALDGGDGGPDGDPLMRSTSQAYAHYVIDHMAAHAEPSCSPRLSLHAAHSHPSYPLLIRHIPSISTSARELALWRYLNCPSSRRDPWNPSPPALSIVERELPISAADRLAHIVEFGTEAGACKDEAYIAMDRLYTLWDNPLESTGDWVDFIRQMLQGLVFLHEHNISKISYAFPDEKNPMSIMMDIGLAPPRFSRAEFPVKYYLLDFAKAVKLRINASTRSSRPLRFTGVRGRSKATVPLTASRPRNPPNSFIGSLVIDTSAVNFNLNLARGRARSDSDMTLISSGNNTPDPVLDVDTPKQSHFFSRPNSPDVFSDPEVDSGSEEASTDEEVEKTVRVVSPNTRALLFSADLSNLARMLRDAVRAVTPVSEALIPVFTAMRQARLLSLSAEDALRMFENAVRPLDVARIV